MKKERPLRKRFKDNFEDLLKRLRVLKFSLTDIAPSLRFARACRLYLRVRASASPPDETVPAAHDDVKDRKKAKYNTQTQYSATVTRPNVLDRLASRPIVGVAVMQGTGVAEGGTIHDVLRRMRSAVKFCRLSCDPPFRQKFARH